jgi:hypothetical protein
VVAGWLVELSDGNVKPFVKFVMKLCVFDVADVATGAETPKSLKRTALVRVGLTAGALVWNTGEGDDTPMIGPLEPEVVPLTEVELESVVPLFIPYSIHVVVLSLLLENVTSWQTVVLLQELRQSSNELLPVVEFISMFWLVE